MANAAEQPDTRTRIINAARSLFLEKGYEATGVKQILAAADANSGSLYHFFPTKEDVLIAVLEQYRELLCPIVIQPVFDRVTDPIERVFGILDGYRRMLLETNCSVGCPIGNLALEVSESHPNARTLIAANFQGWMDIIRQCFDDASDRLPDDIDHAQLATFVLTTMEGGIMQARAFQSIEPFEHSVACVRDYIERLLDDAGGWGQGAA